MDPESLGNTTSKAPRKVRFAPKGPPRRVQKPVVPKIEKTETIDADAQAQELLRRFNEASGKVKPKVEKKVASTQIAFGYGGQSNSIKSYGALKGGIGVNNDGGGAAYSSVLGDQKEYKEPWDYYSYYPITLPLRRPYSGNPELLNEEEFREASENVTYDEHSIRVANDLGLQEENLEASIFFLLLPANMPMVKQSANAEGQEMVNNSEPPKSAGPSKKGCSLDELPGGFMGKMLVYKSGAVKLKLGDIIYDVSAGSDSVFAQDVVAINTEEKHCCVVGELSQRAVITPDVDSILNSISDL
ncbi:DNA-directed RNA polymerase III subunit RPC4 [Camellia lanceoleosa]|uniref:DNA-directed RNA polymerase III subunit RPC4 n=1 Tax=Camellia lanceoleosa TaxID=1840588 RepID=A0ACC0I6L7_9ERIC|nr:DNA-directed RNA polymerase III subunit RPC4 [Camellia lanceoleosa]